MSDNSFKVDDLCDDCGICVQICPVDNIKIVHMKPNWLHKCENCFACYQWCPREAISAEFMKYNVKYHHPEIKLSEMFDNI